MAVNVITRFIVPCLFTAIEEWKSKRSQRLTKIHAPTEVAVET